VTVICINGTTLNTFFVKIDQHATQLVEILPNSTCKLHSHCAGVPLDK